MFLMVVKQERPRQTDAPTQLVEVGQRIIENLRLLIPVGHGTSGRSANVDPGLFWANRNTDMMQLAAVNQNIGTERFEGLLVHQVFKADIDTRYPNPADAQRHYRNALEAERRYHNLHHSGQISEEQVGIIVREIVPSGNQSMTADQYNQASERLRAVARSERDRATQPLSAVPRIATPMPIHRYLIPLSGSGSNRRGEADVAEVQSTQAITDWERFFRDLVTNPQGVNIIVRGSPLLVKELGGFASMRLGLVGPDNTFSSWNEFERRVRAL